MEKEVKHEKEQRILAIDDLYKKLGDYEAHKFKQLCKDGVEIKFEVKDHEKVHKLTQNSSSGSGSGSKKKTKKHKYKRKGKHSGGFGFYGLAGGRAHDGVNGPGDGHHKFKRHKAKFHGKSPWKKKHYKHKKGHGGYMGKHGGFSNKHRKHGRHGYGSYGLGGGEHRSDGNNSMRRHHGKGSKKHNKEMKKGFKGKDIAGHHMEQNGLVMGIDGSYGLGGETSMNALTGSQNMTMGIMAAQHQGMHGKGKGGGMAAAMGFTKSKSSKDLVHDFGKMSLDGKKNKKKGDIKDKKYKVEGDHG